MRRLCGTGPNEGLTRNNPFLVVLPWRGVLVMGGCGWRDARPRKWKRRRRVSPGMFMLNVFRRVNSVWGVGYFWKDKLNCLAVSKTTQSCYSQTNNYMKKNTRCTKCPAQRSNKRLWSLFTFAALQIRSVMSTAVPLIGELCSHKTKRTTGVDPNASYLLPRQDVGSVGQFGPAQKEGLLTSLVPSA